MLFPRVVYQSPDFSTDAPLVLFSQHLLQDDDHKTSAVLADLANDGYHFCVVADRNVFRGKSNYTEVHRERMKQTLIKLQVPVKFAHLEQFNGFKFTIDTDDFDRVDTNGPLEMTSSDLLLPTYVLNTFIVDYYQGLLNKNVF